ncbi:MAG: extensin family protein [Polyangiaceae bacterium]|nr:extensin family protein [Polyangiaceae bacterium]
MTINATKSWLLSLTCALLTACVTIEAPPPRGGFAGDGGVQQDDDLELAAAGVFATAGDVTPMSRAQCTELLQTLGVRATEAERDGVATAVAVSQVRGATLRYATSTSDGTLATDCRTAVALGEFAKFMADRGAMLKRIVHVGSYNPRNIAGTTTASMHSFALAVDLRRFEFTDGSDVEVPRDWDTTLRAFSTARARLVDQGLRATFPSVFGPGSNAAHLDHWHAETLVGLPVSGTTDACSGRASGAWCGITLGFPDASLLVTCSQGLTVTRRSCSPGLCQVHPLGQNDTCGTASVTPSITLTCPASVALGAPMSCTYSSTGLSTAYLRAVLRDIGTRAELAVVSTTLQSGGGTVALGSVPQLASAWELCVTTTQGVVPAATTCRPVAVTAPAPTTADGLRIDPRAALSSWCAGPTLVTWTGNGQTFRAASPGAALTVPTAALGTGTLYIGANCEATGAWLDFVGYRGRTAADLGMAATLTGRDIAGTLRVCSDGTPAGYKLAVVVPTGARACE